MNFSGIFLSKKQFFPAIRRPYPYPEISNYFLFKVKLNKSIRKILLSVFELSLFPLNRKNLYPVERSDLFIKYNYSFFL